MIGFFLSQRINMIFSLSVTQSPYSHQGSLAAYKFAKSALAKGHSIHRIFFYGGGVLNSNALTTPPQDELNLYEAWKKLASDFDIELIVCIASALRRGILDADEAMRYEKNATNLHAPFILSGLGQLLDAVIESDRVITFSN